MAQETTENKSYLNYGIITGVVLIVLFVIYYVFGLLTNKALGLVPLAVYIILVIVAQINHAKALQGNITFGNLFAAGFKTAAAATGIYLVFLLIFILLVPSFKDTMMDAQRAAMVQKGIPADAIEKGMAMGRKIFTVVTIGGGLVINLILGLIAALIGAAVAKKNPVPQSAS